MSYTPTKQVFNVTPQLGTCTTINVSCEWFPWDGEYPACPSAYAPLMNGRRAFGAVAKAIEAAQKSIEIITWGFQSSMYLVRSPTGGGKTLGEYLEAAANRGVQVRILVWFNSVKQKFVGSNFPGWQAYLPKEQRQQGGGFMMEDERWQHTLEQVTRQHNSLLATGDILAYQKEAASIKLGQYDRDKLWHFRADSGHIPNLTIKCRDMTEIDVGWMQSRLQEKVPAEYKLSADISLMHAIAQTTGATHHQKTMMVDYEDPELAVGFVMGHNMLSQYWDDDAHSCIPDAPDKGRDGPTAWQDFSSCVYGQALKGVNDNFARAWARDTGDDSLLARDSIPKENYYPTPERLQAISTRLNLDTGLTPVMARFCRTQPQDGRYDILRGYMESVKNARQYIYIENQYFRFKDLVSKIHEALNNIRAKGFTNDLYLFVVTNSTTDPDISDGGVQTWKMLNALGRGDRMPGYTAALYNNDPKNKDNPVKSEDIQPQQIAGLQTHICTLVSMDRKPGDPPLRTYVHSKLMMIDDIFMIQGSANMNLRSMVFDSESAIMFQDTDHSNIIAPTRDKLWGLHTANWKGGTGNDYKAIFNAWGYLIDRNSKIASSDSGDLLAPLIKFIDPKPNQKDKD